MKLLTKEISDRFAKLGSQEDTKDPIVVLKLFDPGGRWTYFATEYDPDDRVFFGYCISALGADCDEWGYASLDEIEATHNRFGLGMERDRGFQPKPASQVSEIKRI